MNITLVIVTIAVALLPVFAYGQKCDSTTMAQIFNSKSYMDTWNKENSLYLLKLAPQQKVLILYKNVLMDSITWKSSTGAKIRKNQNDFLEIRELTEASYLYYKGNEIRKLIPEIGAEDYFENKIINDEEVIFKFNDGTYGKYNFIKKIFCRTIKKQ